MKVANQWTGYRILSTGDGFKLERWGEVVLLRPDPQVIWSARQSPVTGHQPPVWAEYLKAGGGGRWEIFRRPPNNWTVDYKGMKLGLKLMGFKHTGVFPEQAVNWDLMAELVRKRTANHQSPTVLNLFAYTGAASVALSMAGAEVTHVDAAKNMVERAGYNAKLNGVDNIRYIIDDCAKFIAREIKRGRKYDAIIMDPPSYGRGPSGELWKIEDNLFGLVKDAAKILSDAPLFFLINSYTTGLQPTVIKNILQLNISGKGNFDAYEVGLPTDEGIDLPCGCSGLWACRL